MSDTMQCLRDKALAEHDERILAAMESSDRYGIANYPAPGGSAMLRRDLAMGARANAAMRRFARTPAGRRAAAID
jgi:hypothetical protein